MDRLRRISSLILGKGSVNRLFYGGLVKVRDYPPQDMQSACFHTLPSFEEEVYQSYKRSVVSNASIASFTFSRTFSERARRGLFVCHVCQPTFNSALQLSNHFKSSHPEIKYKCTNCGAHFITEEEMKKHNPICIHLPSAKGWTPPPKGGFKLNTDGSSMGRQEMRGSIGGAFRDENGNVIFLFHDYIGKASSKLAEIKALDSGINLAIGMGYKDFELEFDAQELKHLINKGIRKPQIPEVENCLSSILFALSNIKYRIHSVTREANQLADVLAHEGGKHKAFKLYTSEDIEEAPVVENLILRDKMGIPTPRWRKPRMK